jgi:SAM-dependent methyltransferase
MKRCSSCGSVHDSVTFTCPVCEHSPEEVDGFLAFSPDLAHTGGGYDPDLFAQLAPLEEGSFWFRSRNDLILWALRQHSPTLTSFLEIGCGTGYVLSGVEAEFPRATLLGSEVFVDALPYAAARVRAAELVQMDARDIPLRAEVDVIGAFDVLEHIEEDVEVLGQVHQALKPDGLLMISVPQHRWLWSPADDHAQHVRRYTARELRAKVTGAGFDIERSTSFVSLLLPMILLSRVLMRRRTEVDPIDEMRMPAFLNAVLYRLMRLETALIRRGVDFPLGGSRLVVARKRTAG